MTTQMTIEYPDAYPDILNETREQFEKEVKLAMAVKMFEIKRLSSGMAAVLAGMDRVSFLLILHQYGVPAIDETEDELLSDVKNA